MTLRLEHPGTCPFVPSWIAVRACHCIRPDEPAGHGHFFLGAVDLTYKWAAPARDRGQVLLLVGPVGPHTSLDGLDLEDDETVLALLEDGLARGS
ncbi:hypothetical protein ACFYXM_27860 [Streptomyces sp. NPDC002476]|uniref:hypothetical protein n=1 Tax=Streptomyces sp. NPDC002476 TaxID=3364648 RepID=UPI00368B3482